MTTKITPTKKVAKKVRPVELEELLATAKKKAPVKRKATNAKAAKTLTDVQKVDKWIKENLVAINIGSVIGTVAIVLMSIPF